MTELITLYCTFPNADEAARVSKALVEARLVACANILPAGRSLYFWDGRVQDEAEIYVLYKTKRSLFESVRDKITELHSYDTPCIVAWPIADGHMPYLEWIEKETK